MHILLRNQDQMYIEMPSDFSGLKPVFHRASYVGAHLLILPTHLAFPTLSCGIFAQKHSLMFWHYQCLRLA